MAGLLTLFILLILVAVWLLASQYAAKQLSSFLLGRISQTSRLKPLVLPGAYLLIFVAVPILGCYALIADDIETGARMKALCQTATVYVDEQKAPGKTVRLRGPLAVPGVLVPGSGLPIKEHFLEYEDTTTGEVLVSYRFFIVTGKTLRQRLLPRPFTNGALTFAQSCGGEVKPFFQKYNITVLKESRK